MAETAIVCCVLGNSSSFPFRSLPVAQHGVPYGEPCLGTVDPYVSLQVSPENGAKMKAAVYDNPVPPSVLEYVDVPDPVCGPDEVVIRVKRCPSKAEI